MATKRDYYEVLGVERTATVIEVRSAYRRLAARYHPDVNPGDHTAEEKFKELNEAHEILSSAEKRQVYDQFGHDGPQGGAGGAGFGDIFDMFFGAGGGFQSSRGASSAERTRQQATLGADLRYDLEITMEEAVFGVEKTLKLSRLEPCDTCRGNGAKPGTTPKTCPTCSGSGQMRHVQNTILGSFATVVPCTRCKGEGVVIADPCPACRGQGRQRQTREHTLHVPAGVDTGVRLVDAGQGDAGVRGGQRGDLYVVIYVQPHAQFTRRGQDVVYEAPITFTQAALGDMLDVPILGGTDKLQVPEGTQPGEVFRLRGKGFPDVNGRGKDRGDQLIVVKMQVPLRMSDDQKRLLREFAQASGEKPVHDDERGLFDKVREAWNHK